MRKFVVGDIHGRLDALIDNLDQVDFDFNIDQLISLGDVCDGGPDTRGCVDLLRKVKNLKPIMGNHDWWLIQYIKGKHPGSIWLEQGGKATLRSYSEGIPKKHIKFFNSLLPHYEDEDAIYVHGGIDPRMGVKTRFDEKIWDRSLLFNTFTYRNSDTKYYKGKLVIVGHTQTRTITNVNKPIITEHVIGLDTGAGYGDKLTIMELPSKKYWQSKLPFRKIIRDE